MAIAKLSIDLEARLAGLQQGLDKAGLLAERQADRIEKRYAAISTGIDKAFKAIGFSLVAKQLIDFVGAQKDAILAIKDLSEATGSSIENISGLENVARKAGGSIEDVSGVLIKFNAALKDAEKTKELEASFRALGLSAKELKQLDPAEALRRVAIAMSGFADDGNKARLTQELFGKSIKDAAPFLRELVEQGELHASVTKDQVEEVDRLNKEIAKLSGGLQDFARIGVGAFATGVNQFIADLQRARKEGQSFLSFIDQRWRQSNGEVVDTSAVSRITEEIQRLDEALGNVMLPPQMRTQFQRRRAELAKQLDALRSDAKSQFLRADKDLSQVALPGLPDALGGDKAKKAKPIKADTTPDFDPYLAALKELENTDAGKIERLSATLTELLQLQAAGLAGPSTAQAIEAINKQLEELNPEKRRINDAKKAIDELLGIGLDSGLSRQLDQMQELQKRLESGSISTEAYVDALKKLDSTWTQTASSIENTGQEVGQELALVFSSAAGQAITEWQGFSKLLKGIVADVGQIALKKTVTEPLTNWLSDSLKGFSFASLFAADGHAFSGGRLVPFASGGIVGSPTLFKFSGGTGLMGEAGPEAIMPLKRGRDGKLGVAAGGGRAMNLTINIDSRTDAATIAETVTRAVTAGQRQMLEYMRTQGVT